MGLSIILEKGFSINWYFELFYNEENNVLSMKL